MKTNRSSAAVVALRVLLAAAALQLPAVAHAGPKSCDVRPNDTYAKLLECVTLPAVRAHQAALQAIADANGGTRAVGTTGYDASVDYLVVKLTEAGYNVVRNAFPYVVTPPGILEQRSPVAATYPTGSFTGSGYGSASAAVTAVDINLAGDRANTSGCEAADFAGFPAGNIALVQRGVCEFRVKALNAQAAGATAVVIFNQGNTSDRMGPVSGTLVDVNVVTIPVVGASFDAGVALSQPGSTAYVQVDPPQTITQYNVIAESAGGDPNNVIVVGAHLDSVPAGPGINDNGSGSAAILEVALKMAKVKPRNKLRFAWWGAEEAGLVGSTAYVNGLTEGEKDRIALYLNFDMIGSPNYVFFVLDGDDSDGVGAGAGPVGSDAIEKVFEGFYTQAGVPFKGSDFTGRSDYGPFVAAGIPAGGLFTGAEGVKTAAEQATWGGTAGVAFDPCYHQACDTYANNNDYALGINAHAIAYAVLTYTMKNQSGRARRGPFQYEPEFWGPRARR